MADMNSITNEIKGLEQYVKAMKNSYTHGVILEDLDNLLLHINTLKAWAGIYVEAGENTLPIQHVSFAKRKVCRCYEVPPKKYADKCDTCGRTYI